MISTTNGFDLKPKVLQDPYVKQTLTSLKISRFPQSTFYKRMKHIVSPDNRDWRKKLIDISINQSRYRIDKKIRSVSLPRVRNKRPQINLFTESKVHCFEFIEDPIQKRKQFLQEKTRREFFFFKTKRMRDTSLFVDKL